MGEFDHRSESGDDLASGLFSSKYLIYLCGRADVEIEFANASLACSRGEGGGRMADYETLTPPPLTFFILFFFSLQFLYVESRRVKCLNDYGVRSAFGSIL